MVCVCIICQWHPKYQPTVALEKPGIEPATPGLQGMRFIHYTTAASTSEIRVRLVRAVEHV